MRIFKYRTLNHILFWIFIYVFYTLPYILTSGFDRNALLNMQYIPFDIVTVYFVIEFLIPKYLLRNRNLLIFLFGSTFIIGLNFLVSMYIKYNISPLLGFWTYRYPLIKDLSNSLLTNFMIVGTASALKLFSYYYKFQLTKSEMERKTVQSELGILRSQVNPHFLFNVLNNIDALIYEDKEKASNAIFLLSKIMRYMLHETSHEKVRLDKEINYIKDYIELARLSFEDHNFLIFEAKGSQNGKEVPPLLFIPIIENAIKHCNKQSESPGIKILFNIENDFIELNTFNYIKRSDFKLPNSGTGTGLKNVEKRLKLIHGDNYVLKITKEQDKFYVHLKVPLL